ncbi:MAG: hypothetical protein ACK5RN_05840 [bacterium]
MKTILILTAGTLLAGFAPAPAVVAHDPEPTEIVGWVRFSDGEFQLYEREVQVLRPFSRPCLSGVASRDLMRQAVQDLNGRQVKITGVMADWAQAENNRMEVRGSVVRNVCRGETVLLADRVEVLQ